VSRIMSRSLPVASPAPVSPCRRVPESCPRLGPTIYLPWPRRATIRGRRSRISRVYQPPSLDSAVRDVSRGLGGPIGLRPRCVGFWGRGPDDTPPSHRLSLFFVVFCCFPLFFVVSYCVLLFFVVFCCFSLFLVGFCCFPLVFVVSRWFLLFFVVFRCFPLVFAVFCCFSLFFVVFRRIPFVFPVRNVAVVPHIARGTTA
jgi:hypothetical protein